MSAQQLLIEKYGIPDAEYQSKFCIIWMVQQDFPWFPAKRIFINKDFKDMLFKAFTGIQEDGLQDEIKTYDGCYNQRQVRGLHTTSLHAWAAAIDLNASIEALGEQGTNWSSWFLQTMKDAGIFWGGDFHNASRHDGMHFAMFDG